ncbi:MAG: N-6 DNA methylase [Verrucomicrobiota bacterium]
MLDTDTKRRIDTARDILVGKVPDPKSQVEQITIALIYKFMDDMDAEAEELGGERSFFTGEYARYSWAKLMAPSLGGHEMLGLYGEGIAKMPENPGIPALFRDIFKNAYLPYRDPETLKAFLKIIDEFSYDHSERLGDAFEYLLSVLGSQGDAGQFRTPRHIIDFMVEILAPQKGETILDPACGTAGFLISAYKHIRNANTDAKGNSTLTPDDRTRMAKNFLGYDISPDMVRLSLVNLYLHGFTEPHVYEYDTLTSQDRWNEFADVILANPPFMSPKGGIKPHNRFSIQAKRSEVLFVDYMAEHLTPTGRAAIIVPEGVIFQSQTAYKDLRKLLVENSLVAVVSLPAGCFNPYSGVKTSILILDKSLARQSETVGFFKVENDGFGLGAQRRAIGKNDLPQVQSEVAAYLHALRSGERSADILPVNSTAQIVPKEKIAANGDYNLSGERYREGAARTTCYPIISLGEVAEVVAGQSPPSESYNETGSGIAFYQGKTEFGEMFIGTPKTWTTDPQRFAEAGDILISVRAPVGPVNLATQRMCIGRGLAAIKPAASKLMFSYAFYFLRSQEAHIKGDAGAVFASINRSQIEELQIPLPPLEVQKEIVAEIEGYQKVINGARAVLDHYRPHIPIHPDWPMVPIAEVAVVKSGYGFPLDRQGKTAEEIPFLKVSDMNLPGNEKEIVSWNHSVSRKVLRELKGEVYPKGTVIFPKIGAAIGTNKKRILTRDSTYDNNVMGIIPDSKRLITEYLHTYLLAFDLSRWASESQPPSMRKTTVEAHKIPLPPLATQQAIVAEIEAEQALVSANRELITRFERKIQATLARVWGEGEAAAPAPALAGLASV